MSEEKASRHSGAGSSDKHEDTHAQDPTTFAAQVSRSLRKRKQAKKHSLHVHVENDPAGKQKTGSSLSKWLASLVRPYWAWIPPTLTWAKLKPVFRSALVAWICLVLMMIQPVQTSMGTASFLILIGAFIQPAEAPFATCIEREFFLLLFLCGSWAYSCIGIAIAYAVRENKLPMAQVSSTAVFQGQYIEAKPAIVCGFFLAFGAAILMYIKMRFGPSPFLFATVLSCILIDICLTYAPLFPYANYAIGKQVLIPMSIKSAVTIVVSLVFFPKSTNSQFVERMIAILSPLSRAMNEQRDLLRKSPLEDGFDFQLVHNRLNQAEAGLMPLQMSARLLTREVSFGHASGADLKRLEILTRKLIPPADGMSFYYAMVRADLTHNHFPKTPIASRLTTPGSSRPATPVHSRPPTRPPSPHHDETPADEKALRMEEEGQIARPEPRRAYSGGPPPSSQANSGGHNHHSLFHNILHPKHGRTHSPDPSMSSHRRLSRYFHTRHDTAPVGTWESLRYAEVEAHMHPESADVHSEAMMKLLGDSEQDLLQANEEALQHVIRWLERLNHERAHDVIDRFFRPRAALKKSRENALIMKGAIASLEDRIDVFSTAQRLAILEPFKNDDLGLSSIPHRYLYQVLVHQYHLLDTSEGILRLLKEASRICEERPCARLWFPDLPKLWRSDAWREVGEDAHEVDEEDPNELMGASSSIIDLGASKPRDPDALEPETPMEHAAQALFKRLARLHQGNILFAWKAAVLTGVLSVPTYLKSSAEFMYVNKAIWSLFMAQLTLSRFKGDTTFGLVSRIIATVWGSFAGVIIWYISTGSGEGNAYGLGATCAIAFPLIFLARLYFPAPPITSIITTVTVGLVIGYSWQDSFNPPYGELGWGISVGWRRLVGVIVGVTAAFFMSLLPPSHTLRQNQRFTHARTITEIASLFTRIITHASEHNGSEPTGITKSLIALRSKLRRTNASSANVAFEVSLRGKWPRERYQKLYEVQMELSKLLSHLLSVVEKLPEPYRKALLRRTRLSDPLFIGDVIAVLALCSTALRTGSPLPQITPCPLFDRYLLFQPGFDLIREDEEDHLGLPLHVNMDTLKDANYGVFAVGCSTCAGLVLRLDKLCLLVKELVGESYHVPTDLSSRNAIFDRYRNKRQM